MMPYLPTLCSVIRQPYTLLADSKIIFQLLTQLQMRPLANVAVKMCWLQVLCKPAAVQQWLNFYIRLSTPEPCPLFLKS